MIMTISIIIFDTRTSFLFEGNKGDYFFTDGKEGSTNTNEEFRCQGEEAF